MTMCYQRIRPRPLLKKAVTGTTFLIRKLCLSLLFSLLFLFFSTYAYAQAEGLKNTYERAVNAYNKQQYAQAMELYQQIIKVVPDFAPAYNGMALANQALSGNEDKTIEYLKTAIKHDPKLAQAYDNLGRIYYGRQDIDNAQEYFEKALKADPNISSAQLSLAWINLLARSRPRAAIRYFKMALAGYKDAKIFYGLGQAYFASNQRADAMEMITKLHEMGEEELASRLEKSLRENNAVNTESGAGMGNSSAPPAGLGPLSPTPDQPTGKKAHLRGKLSDY